MPSRITISSSTRKTLTIHDLLSCLAGHAEAHARALRPTFDAEPLLLIVIQPDAPVHIVQAKARARVGIGRVSGRKLAAHAGAHVAQLVGGHAPARVLHAEAQEP